MRIIPPEVPAPAAMRSMTSGIDILAVRPQTDDPELERLQCQRKVTEALTRQAELLEAQATLEPLDPNRFHTLPERVQIDLLMFCLGVLLRRHDEALDRAGLDPSCPEQTIAKFERRPTLNQSIDRVVGALDHQVSGRRRVTLTQDDATVPTTFRSALTEHLEKVFTAVVESCGWGANKDQATKMSKIAEAYTRSPKGDRPDLPDLETLCEGVLCGVGGVSLSAECASGGEWSTDCWWPLGAEDAVASLLGRAHLLDPAFSPPLGILVARMNQEDSDCLGECCIAYLAENQCFGVLYRRGRHEQALTQLGLDSSKFPETEEPSEPQTAPGGAKEKSLKSLWSWARRRSQDTAAACSSGHVAQVTEQQQQQPSLSMESSMRLRSIPRAWLLGRELFTLLLGGRSGAFDARSRAALLEILGRLGIPRQLIRRWEKEIGGALFDALEAKAFVERQNKSRRGWNRGKVALAAAGGGILLAVTGGLAAPAVAPALAGLGVATASAGAAVGLAQAGLVLGIGLTAFGAAVASLGTAGAAILFGVTGAGITGWKMSKRWGDLDDFSFVPLMPTTATVHCTVDVKDPAELKKIEDSLKAGNGYLSEDQIVQSANGQIVLLRCKSKLQSRAPTPTRPVAPADSAPPTDISPSIGKSFLFGDKAKPTEAITETLEFTRDVDELQRAVHLVLFVSGWIRDEKDITELWVDGAKVYFPSSGHVALKWELRELKRLSSVFSEMLAQGAASQAASWFMRAGAATAGTASLVVAWPVWIIASMANLDNAWLVCIEKARLAGVCLAHALADRHNVGQRPVTLIGHSIGARLVFYCLLELYNMGEFNVVDDVVLVGAPVSTKQIRWRKVRAVASGRVVNGYLDSDWVLAFLYRYMEWGVTVAGLSEVQVPGVENVNLKGLGIAGHHDYPAHMSNILAKMRIGEQHIVIA